MSNKPTKADYLAYAKRWRAVNEYERTELRLASASHRLMQLAALMASAELFSRREDSEEDAQTWARWNLLREAHRG